MDKKIIDRLEQSLDKSKLLLIKPEEEAIDAVLAVSSNELSTMSDYDISKCIYTLAQYQVWLQVYCNMKHIKYLEAKRTFDIALSKVTASLSAKTLKEKNQQAIENNKQLQELEKDLKIKEHDYLLFDKIPDSISELANALKKELSIRLPGNKRYNGQ